MSAPAVPTFLESVKTACTGAPHTPLVLLGNFEVEDEWARGEIGLPSVGVSSAAAVVNRMDEFALLLAGKADHVVLKAEPDPEHLAYLAELGVDLPNILVVDDNDPNATVSADALRSPRLLAVLTALAATGAHLLPHGQSALEDELCARTGLPSALPPSAVVKPVNSKIYSRRLARELGMPLATGWECTDVECFAACVEQAKRVLDGGATVGVKDAYGVSGKGILVTDDPRKLDQLVRMVTRKAQRTGDDRLALVIEQWADKAVDLNYHFTVSRDGAVRFDFVKEAITAGGVHKGHRMPARISGAHEAVLRECAELTGARLAADGFHGVVGVDAITTTAGALLPMLEINARNNMSTYQTTLQERFIDDGVLAVARQYDLTLTEPLAFGRVRAALGDLLFTAAGGRGLLVNNFATVNAAAARGKRQFGGRLYGLLLAGDDAELTAIDEAVTTALAAVTTEPEGQR